MSFHQIDKFDGGSGLQIDNHPYVRQEDNFCKR